MDIGNWVKRKRNGSKWHLVETIVADDPITRCGRRLDWSAEHALEVSVLMPLTRMIDQPQLCKLCH